MEELLEQKLNFYKTICFSLNINFQKVFTEVNNQGLSLKAFMQEEELLLKENRVEDRTKLIEAYQTQNYEQTIKKLFYSEHSEYKLKQKLEDIILENFKLFLMNKYQLTYEKVENIFPKVKQLLSYFSLHTHFYYSDFFAMLQGNNDHMIKNFTVFLNQSEEELLSRPELIFNQHAYFDFLKTLDQKITISKTYEIKMELENLFTKELAEKYLDTMMSNIDLDIKDLYELTDNQLKESKIISEIYDSRIKQVQKAIPTINSLMDDFNLEYQLKQKNMTGKTKKIPLVIKESKKKINEVITMIQFAKKDLERIKQDIDNHKIAYTELSFQDEIKFVILMREKIESYLDTLNHCSPGIRNSIASKIENLTSLQIEHIYTFLIQQKELLQRKEEIKKTNRSQHETSISIHTPKENISCVKTEEDMMEERRFNQEQMKHDKEREREAKKQEFLEHYWDAFLVCTNEAQVFELLGTKDIPLKVNFLLEKIKKEQCELNDLKEISETTEELNLIKQELLQLETLKLNMMNIQPFENSFQKIMTPKK